MKDNSERLFAIRNFLTPTHTSKQHTENFPLFSYVISTNTIFPRSTHVHASMLSEKHREEYSKSSNSIQNRMEQRWGGKTWWRMWRLGEREKRDENHSPNDILKMVGFSDVVVRRYFPSDFPPTNTITCLFPSSCMREFSNSFLSLVWVDLIWIFRVICN